MNKKITVKIPVQWEVVDTLEVEVPYIEGETQEDVLKKAKEYFNENKEILDLPQGEYMDGSLKITSGLTLFKIMNETMVIRENNEPVQTIQTDMTGHLFEDWRR